MVGFAAQFNAFLNLAKAQLGVPVEGPSGTLPVELRVKIAQQVVADELAPAQQGTVSRQHAEVMAGKALASLALQNRDWARCAYSAEQARPSLGRAVTQQAIARLARRLPDNVAQFRTAFAQLVGTRKHVAVAFNTLTPAQQAAALDVLAAAPPLGSLTLRGFSPSNGAKVAQIAHNAAPSLKLSLDLAGQGLATPHVPALRALLSHAYPPSVSLDLRWNPLSEDQVAALGMGHGTTQVTHGWNLMSPRTAGIVRAVLNQERDDAILDLSRYEGLTGEDVAAVIGALGKNAGRHTVLYLNAGLGAPNTIDVEGVKALASLLTHPDCRLAKLNLTNGGVEDEGAEALAKALAHKQCPLTHLNLKSNFITPAGGVLLAQGIETSNGRLRSVNIGANPLDEPTRERLIGGAQLREVNLHCLP